MLSTSGLPKFPQKPSMLHCFIFSVKCELGLVAKIFQQASLLDLGTVMSLILHL